MATHCYDFRKIVPLFAIEGECVCVQPLGNGLINDTFKVITSPEGAPDYVLQRINTAVFRDVPLMQDNILRITSHIRNKLQERGADDIGRRTLTVVPARDGALFATDIGGGCWRMTEFIPRTKTLSEVTPESAYLTGKAFGDFQKMLSDLPGGPLGATIPDFHNMSFRLRQLHEAVEKDCAARAGECAPLLKEILSREREMLRAEDLHRRGLLPKRITHCDTKVDNMLFDESGRFLCVIDLDTTMPGFVLSDFGDFMRTAANTGAEDDMDLGRVGLDMDIFKSFSRGYVESAKSFLTPVEMENLPFGAQMMTYMQAVRFLTDYLDGDCYYKTAYPGHNLQRTKAQLAMLRSLDMHLGEMEEFINSLTR
ncbi:MAG: phosphotransferase enzyme family protein [Candidatus Cryptobacteroides sp.]